jgi:choline dehydrogenase-like flavoprotein
MVYIRGNVKDYDNWEAMGNYGWGFRDVLHYFKKSEDNLNPYVVRNSKSSSSAIDTRGLWTRRRNILLELYGNHSEEMKLHSLSQNVLLSFRINDRFRRSL